MTKQIIVIGRGHSATRIMIHTLQASGIYCGQTSASGDLYFNRQKMYDAVRLFGAHVGVWDNYEWDFSRVLLTPYPDEFKQLVCEYVKGFCGLHTYGWKLPESTLALPWLVQLFPDAYYIHWVRDGRDNILRWHGTDDNWYGVDNGGLPEDRVHRAALSWDYHEELIAQTPKPARWLRVRLEDFLEDQPHELQRIGEFLGWSLVDIWVNPNVAGRYKTHDLSKYMPILQRHLRAHGYIEEGISVGTQ